MLHAREVKLDGDAGTVKVLVEDASGNKVGDAEWTVVSEGGSWNPPRSRDFAFCRQPATVARVAQLRPLFPRQPVVAEFDLLAMAYRGQGNWLRAERLYQKLRVDRIGDAAHWHYPLARHYELAGRPRLALEHYESAIEKDSASSAAEAIRRLRLSAPTCVLRW